MKPDVQVVQGQDIQESPWDDYVLQNPHSSYCHLLGWREVIARTYKHNSYYLQAVNSQQTVQGILPLIHIEPIFLANRMSALPFLDLGGILADSEQAEVCLLEKALELSTEKGIKALELRQQAEISAFNPEKHYTEHAVFLNPHYKPQKMRMLRALPATARDLWSEIPSKLRSQIRKPIKSGCQAKVGGLELVDDFYQVFAEHMRDLGSPVHSRDLFVNTLRTFPHRARLCLVYLQKTPIAGSVFFAFKNVVSNPWSSALRRFSPISPNMLLYWTMLEYACDHGYDCFDFGRSTQGEGTFRFKLQWGAKAEPLFWYTLTKDQGNRHLQARASRKYSIAVRLWSKMPVTVSTMLGPHIRKYISL